MNFIKGISQSFIDDKQVLNEINNTINDYQAYQILIEKGITHNEIVDRVEDYFAVKYIYLNNYKIKNIDNELLKIFKDEDIIIVENPDTGEEYYVLNDILNDSKIKLIQDSLNTKNINNFRFAFDFEIREKYKGNNTIKQKSIRLDNNIVVSEWVDSIIDEGIKINASDIHIEPTEEGIQTRYRVDGDLVFKKNYIVDEDLKSKIVSRVKVISNMDVSEKRKPQDGKISNYLFKNDFYEIRVSTISLVIGEKIVFRVAKKNMDYTDFKDLGFSEKAAEDTKRYLKSKNGIIFLGGATGSGKTTTLYAMINYLNEDTKNIYTIEDPVEKKMDNINQIEIHEKGGITYPNTLRALLRQDPDIIVVGEIRDLETAELAANGSLTGHLMLSTVHANDALGTITRLLDMNLEPFLLGTTAIAFYSQRLVKTLCNHCKVEKTEYTKAEKMWLKKVEEKYGISYNMDNPIYEEVGCEHCIDGNIGRTALVEYIEVNNELKNAILDKENEKVLLDIALRNDFKPFITTGLEKVKNGEVSLKTLIEAEIV